MVRWCAQSEFLEVSDTFNIGFLFLRPSKENNMLPPPHPPLRGAKLCVVKTQRKAKQAETLTQDYIITRKLLAWSLPHTSLFFSSVVLISWL